MRSKAYLLMLLLSMLASFLHAQSQQDSVSPKIEIVQAGWLEIAEVQGERYRKLFDDVILKQDDVVMHCDSALFYPDQNMVRAYGQVSISEGDSLEVYGDSLHYSGNAKRASIWGDPVKMNDRRMQLETAILSYYLNERLAIYRGGGSLHNGQTRLVSKSGYYYASSETAYFRDSVELRNPDYQLFADTLEYRINGDLTVFHGPTHIINGQNEVDCSRGYYDGANRTALFAGRATMNNPPQMLAADSIFYDREMGFGQAYGKVVFIDSVQQVTQQSDYAEYFEKKGTINANGHILISYQVDADSMFISSDSLRTLKDSTTENRTTITWSDVRLYKSNLQGLCDSLVWSEADSAISLFIEPVLWADSTQFTGDTVVLHLVDRQLKRIDMLNEGFIVNSPDSLFYNQIGGREIFGYFSDEQLQKLEVEGNGRSVYYAQDDNGSYLGINKAVCSRMIIYMAQKQVQKISYLSSPEATFNPMTGLDASEFQLNGFIWLESRRPLSKQGILKYRGTESGSAKDDIRGPYDQLPETSNPNSDKSDQ